MFNDSPQIDISSIFIFKMGLLLHKRFSLVFGLEMDQISVQIAQLPLCSAQWSIIIFNLEERRGEKSILGPFRFLRSSLKFLPRTAPASPFFSGNKLSF